MAMRLAPITSMPNGRSGKVVRIEGGLGLCMRLEALGVRAGAEIVKKSAVMSRGPIIVGVGMGEVAMGYGMAARILVEVEE